MTSLRLIDTHTHLDQPEFDDDRDEMIARAHAAGVDKMVAVGISAETSQMSMADDEGSKAELQKLLDLAQQSGMSKAVVSKLKLSAPDG